MVEGMKEYDDMPTLGPIFWLSVGWIVFIVFCAASVDLWPLPESDHMDFMNQAALPGAEGEVSILRPDGKEITTRYRYLLGADAMGRDIFTRLVFGARVSLAVGLATPFIGFVIGGALGLLAGFYRGRLESVIVGVMDAILAFPGLVLLLAITFYLGPSLRNIIIALGFLTIPAFTRVARAKTLAFSEREFVQAARMLGQGDASILFCEILPNIVMPMVVYALLLVSYMIVAEGTLSFLGLGPPAPTPSWGGMIAEGKEVLDETPHVSAFPALIMFLTVLSFNLVGD
ncbi:MAG: ABC transporter permease, partial [Desulfobacterales bacterium]|nr:ABC transporter permease [Desulfobacterales bacterium]